MTKKPEQLRPVLLLCSVFVLVIVIVSMLGFLLPFKLLPG